MLKRICDRCGAEVLQPSTGFELHSDLDEVVDLCKKCDKELNKWMDDPETTVVTPLEEDAMYSSIIPDIHVNDIRKINNAGRITTKGSEFPVINCSCDDKEKVSIDSLPKYFTISREEYARLCKKEQMLDKIKEIAHNDELDWCETAQKIIEVFYE